MVKCHLRIDEDKTYRVGKLKAPLNRPVKTHPVNTMVRALTGLLTC
jgi:hypothetical protein